MKFTQSALGMLVKRYRSVLKKCRLLNIFGAVAMAGALALGTADGVFGETVRAPSVTMDQVVTGTTSITATNGNVILQGGVDGANGTISAAGTPSATVGNISAVDANGVWQPIIQGEGNSLHLEATGNINSGQMTVNSARAGKDIIVTGTLQSFAPAGAGGQASYGDIVAGGNIEAFDSTQAAGSQAQDIYAGNVEAAGTIKAGDITTHGDLTAKRLETYANSDSTISNNRGSVTVNGAVNLSGTGADASVTGRRFDITNTKGSANSIGDITTGACITLFGNGEDLSTATGGIIKINGSYTQGNGMQAKIDYLDMNVSGFSPTRTARVQGKGPVSSILEVNTLNLNRGNLILDTLDPDWKDAPSIAIIQSMVAENNALSNNADKLPADVNISNGNIVLGQNSMAVFGKGASQAWMQHALQTATGVDAPRKGGMEAVLALYQPMRINYGIQSDTGIGQSVRPFHIYMDGGKFNTEFDYVGKSALPAGPLWTQNQEAPTYFQAGNTLLIVNGDNSNVHFATDKPQDADNTLGAISYEPVPTDDGSPVTLGTAEIQSGASLMITSPLAGETYVVLGEGFDHENGIVFESDAAWAGDNIMTDNPLVILVRDDLANPGSGGKGYIQARLNSAANVFPGLDGELVSAIDNAVLARQIGNTEAARTTGPRGTQFLSRAVGMAAPAPYGYGEAHDATVTIESAARMAVLGAVPQMALAANNAAGDAVTQRTSIANPSSSISAIDVQGNVIGDQNRKKGLSLWIMPLYQSTNGFGMEAGNFDYDFSGALGGVSLGADWTFDNAIRAGILFNIGGGYAKGSGDLNETTNNMNFWGIGAYAGWNMNGFGITADVNYTSTFNELKQDLPYQMGWDELKADINAWALSAGVRGEYKFEFDSMDVIPHVGVRFINLNVDSYDITHSGTVIDGDSITQNIWTFPIGVTLTRDIVMENGWHLKPLLDLNVTPAAGDVKAKGKIRFTGTGSQAELDTKIMDYITYGGTVGLEFGKENFTIGVNYNGQFGAESTAHGVFGMFRYEF